MGSGGGAEQAKAAISHAPLGRIRVDHLREEACGFQKDGHGPHGAPSNSETDPNHDFGVEMRCAFKIQRRYSRHSETHDNLEAGLGGIHRSFKKDGVKYGGGNNNEH